MYICLQLTGLYLACTPSELAIRVALKTGLFDYVNVTILHHLYLHNITLSTVNN